MLKAPWAWIVGGVRIRQFVGFSLSSAVLSPEEITAELGLEPDRCLVRGSKRSDPPVPVGHVWEVRCDERGLRIDEQADRVFRRIRPHADSIRELIATSPVGAVLSICRDFEADDGEEELLAEVAGPDGDTLTKLAGQHQLLGWHLDVAFLAFLVTVGADIDCDEYGE